MKTPTKIEVFTFPGQSHESIVASGRTLCRADGSVLGAFVWSDYAKPDAKPDAKPGDLVRKYDNGYRYFLIT